MSLPAFEQLAADEPAVANQVLFSAVGALEAHTLFPAGRTARYTAPCLYRIL